MRLKEKVAIVTGGTQGIGEAIAVRYGAEGARVAVIYHHNDASADAVVKRMTAPAAKRRGEGRLRQGAGHRTHDCRGDQALRHYRHPGQQCRCLPHGADRRNHRGDLGRAARSQSARRFFCVKAALPEFRRKGGGKVINITSIAGVGAFPNCPAYCASKGGLEILTKALAAELGKENINVNSLGARQCRDPVERSPARAGQRGLHQSDAHPDADRPRLPVARGNDRRGGVPRLRGRLRHPRRHPYGRRRLVGDLASRLCGRPAIAGEKHADEHQHHRHDHEGSTAARRRPLRPRRRRRARRDS